MGIIDRTKENGLRNNLHMLMNEVTRDGYRVGGWDKRM